jgi:cyclase
VRYKLRRLIPILLIKDRLLYKTSKFSNPIYIGDPIISLKIFNEKEVDELMILDISNLNDNYKPDFDYLSILASEAFMPLSYGGGISSVDDAKRILEIGFEKIVINTSLKTNFGLLNEISSVFGSQAVVVSVDYKIDIFGRRLCYFNHGKMKSQITPLDFCNQCVESGAGEILLQCISYEGSMEKMDINYIRDLVQKLPVPVIGTGGTPSYNYIQKYFIETNASALAAGSIFVYHGPHNAVLINYPDYEKKEKLLNER